jgi:hypothetical protein
MLWRKWQLRFKLQHLRMAVRATGLLHVSIMNTADLCAKGCSGN